MVSLNADIMHDLCVIICHKLVVPHIIVDLLRKSKYFYTDASVLYGMSLSLYGCKQVYELYDTFIFCQPFLYIPYVYVNLYLNP